MTWQYCRLCWEWFACYTTSGEFLCRFCTNLLLAEEEPEKHWTIQFPSFETCCITTIFPYTGIIRDIILQIKVHSNYVLADTFIHFLCKHQTVRNQVLWADKILPAPSSAWARLRGKPDFAGLFAMKLAFQNKKPYIKAPLSSYFSWTKRAKKQKNNFLSKKYTKKTSKNENKNMTKILIIDDIITTGYTLYQTSKFFKHSHIKCMTIAKS